MLIILLAVSASASEYYEENYLFHTWRYRLSGRTRLEESYSRVITLNINCVCLLKLIKRPFVIVFVTPPSVVLSVAPPYGKTAFVPLILGSVN